MNQHTAKRASNGARLRLAQAILVQAAEADRGLLTNDAWLEAMAHIAKLLKRSGYDQTTG